MTNTLALGIFFLFLLVGLFLYLLVMQYSGRVMKKEVSLRLLFKGFRQKMWMTVGLGLIFFGIYFSAVYVGSFFINPEMRLSLFFFVYRHPVACIYLGLFIFACTTTCIYLARIWIIHLYNTRR